MTQAKIKPLNFEKFLEQYPGGKGKYELINGEMVEMRATRGHDNVARFIWKQLDREIEKSGLNYIVDRTILVKVITSAGKEQGRIPDVSLVNRDIWNDNLSDYNALIEPLQLAVEITSTNWEDDYIYKLDEYQRLGINEYWIVDYQAIASGKYLGNPKTPAIFIHYLVDNRYEVVRFANCDRIFSPTFPNLELTVDQVVTSQIA